MKKLVLFLACLFVWEACVQRRVVVVEKPAPPKGPPPHAKAWGYKKKMRYYYYYPSVNVYFDISLRKYIYWEGGRWVNAVQLPPSYAVSNAYRVKIDYEGDDPYKMNAEHKMKYQKGSQGRADENPGKKGQGKGKSKGK